MLFQSILLQVQIWQNIFFYLFIVSGILFFPITLVMMRALKKKSAEIKLIQQQHVAKVDIIRKEHSDTLEKIRIEMLKREEERNRQWMESEKETLHVLNGVSILLDLSEKIGRVESEKILKKLDEIQLQVRKITIPE
jgi:hypothetical protein